MILRKMRFAIFLACQPVQSRPRQAMLFFSIILCKRSAENGYTPAAQSFNLDNIDKTIAKQLTDVGKFYKIFTANPYIGLLLF